MVLTGIEISFINLVLFLIKLVFASAIAAVVVFSLIISLIGIISGIIAMFDSSR